MISSLKPYPVVKDSGVSWLGKVPEHWEIRRAKTLFRCVDIRSSSGQEELLTVSSRYGVIPRRTAYVTMFKAESYVGYKLCWPGDLVINSLWAWAKGLGVSRCHGIVSSAYGIYRLKPGFEEYAKFIHELVRSTPFQWELQVRSKGIWTSRLQLTDGAFLEAPFPFPPPEDRDAIVRFLDYYDRKIRRYIRAKQKLTKLLEEQKQAIIHRAVTRGLDPDVRLKPSGLTWLVEIPEHWTVRRNGYLFTQRNETGFPGLPILEVSLRTGVRIRDFQNSDRKQVMSDRSKYKRAAKNDIAYNMMRMWQGAVGVAPVDGLVSPAYVVAVPKEGTLPKYFESLFHVREYMREVDAYSRGIVKDRNRLYWEDFKQMPSLCPPFAEQLQIASAIADKTQAISHGIEQISLQISLLREFHTRLIADVVTGKLDVREAAAQLPDEDGGQEPFDEAELAATGLEDFDDIVASEETVEP